MYNVSSKWNKTIYKNPTSVLNIYIDDELVNPKYILDFKPGCTISDKDFCFGSVSSAYIELKIHKDSGITNPKKVRVEYGILINNALTVAELNKMLVKDFNNLKIKSLAKYDNSFEIIQMGIYNVDDYTDDDGNTFTIKVCDNIIKLDQDDGYYDASEIIKKKGSASLAEIAQDICDKKGLELATTTFLNSDKRVAVYDNTVTAREYMGYIAESAEGFCVAGRDGKIYIKSFGEPVEEISLSMFKTYKYGEDYKVSRVAYEDGTRSFKFGDTSNSTIWIAQENMFIVDEDQIKNIYNQMLTFELTSFEGTCAINPALDYGDIITVGGKPVIYQGELSFNGRFIADINSQISIQQKQDTTVKTTSQKLVNRKVQSSIDQIEGNITQIIQEQYDNNEKVSKVEQTLDSLNSKISDIADITISKEGQGSVTLENINESEPIRIEIRPLEEDIAYLHTHSKLTIPNILKNRKVRFQTSDYSIDWELPTDLLYYDADNYDELILDYNSHTLTVNKKVAYNADGTKYLLTLPTTESYDYPEILLQEGDYTVSLLGYTKSYMFVRLMSKNIYTTQFMTKAEINSAIEEKADSITLSVNQKLSNYSTTQEINTKISAEIGSLTSTVQKTYATKTELTTAKTEIKQTTDSISSTVSNKVGKSEIASTINQTAQSVKISASKIDLSGYATFTALKTSGSTTINGSNITTGTIDASKVTVKNLNASNITSGTISASKISGGTLSLTGTNTTISSTNFNVDKNGKITATEGKIGGWTIGSTSLKSTNSKGNKVTLNNGSGDYQDVLVVVKNDGSYPFYLRADGTLYSSNATISGKITSNNATITGGSLKVGNNFRVDTSGNLTCEDGSLKIKYGDIETIKFTNTGLRYYNSYKKEIGGLIATEFNGSDGHLFLTLTKGTSLNISKTSNDGGYFTDAITVDDSILDGHTPYIINTSSGKITVGTGFLNFENGLLKDYVEGNGLSTVISVKLSSGKTMDITVERGLITKTYTHY